jgi:N-acetylglutamate synthase-like GNAT family acetyltransferase
MLPGSISGGTKVSVYEAFVEKSSSKSWRTNVRWHKDEFMISDERELADTDAVYSLLKETYWAKNRSKETVETTIKNSLCFSVFDHDRQVGFARLLIDSVHSILLDVVIHKDYRGKGLGKWLVECITNHPAISNLIQILWTVDADGLYEKFGFSSPEKIIFMIKKPSKS